MSGKINDKTYGVSLIIVVSIFVLLFVANRLILRQMDDLKEPTTKRTVQVKENHPVFRALPKDSRHGIPEIDPVNDPLAPVTQTTDPFKAWQKKHPPQEDSSGPEKIFEFPQTNTMLLQ